LVGISTATCPTGRVAIAGGFLGTFIGEVVASSRDGVASWSVVAANLSPAFGSPITGNFAATAVCATASGSAKHALESQPKLDAAALLRETRDKLAPMTKR
jgi:hypothetical protein